MLPLGLMLPVDDVPLQRAAIALMDWLDRHRPSGWPAMSPMVPPRAMTGS